MSTTAETSHTDARFFEVRAAVEPDADQIFVLLEQLAVSYVPERTAFSAALSNAIQHPDDHILLVAVDAADAVIAYALVTVARLFYTNGTAAQLQELVVDSGWRGRRVGTTLVSAVESLCRTRGVVQLTVASLRAAAFYDGLGYRSTADYLKKTLDA